MTIQFFKKLRENPTDYFFHPLPFSAGNNSVVSSNGTISSRQFLSCPQAKIISVQARVIAFCLCLSGLTLLKLETKTSKGCNNPLEAKYWPLPITSFPGGLQKVEG